jgi:hypothetical protein
MDQSARTSALRKPGAGRLHNIQKNVVETGIFTMLRCKKNDGERSEGSSLRMKAGAISACGRL